MASASAALRPTDAPAARRVGARRHGGVRRRRHGRQLRRPRGRRRGGRRRPNARTPDAGQAAVAVVRPGAVRRLLRRSGPGLLRGRSASTSRSSRAASTSCRRRSSPTATPTSRSRGCRRRSPAARPAPNITDIAQIFQRSGTLQVSFKDKDITTPADFAGKTIGNWGFGNEYEIFAALPKAGLDPAKDVTLVAAELRHGRPARPATSTPPRR